MPDHLTLIVGAGPMAVAHAKVLRALGRRTVAVCRSAERAAAFTRVTGVPAAHGGVEAWLDHNRGNLPAAAVIATDLESLESVGLQVLQTGIPRVLLEKPAALGAAGIDRLATAVENKTQAFVAYNRRFYASVQAARRIIEEDGGALSGWMDFTEVASRTVVPGRSPDVLANWYLANSSHVVDTFFHLCGEPSCLATMKMGELSWHPTGAAFSGHGQTEAGTLFGFIADWRAPGRWGIDIRTAQRRLLLQPMETLQVQGHDSFALQASPSDPVDVEFKPGLMRQMEAFLSARPEASELPSLADHARRVRQAFLPLVGGPG